MSEEVNIEVVNSRDIDLDDDVIKLTEDDINEYYKPVPIDELPDPDVMKNNVIALLEFLGTDDALVMQTELQNDKVFRQSLVDKFSGEGMDVIVKYILDGHSIDDLWLTIESFDNMKNGGMTFDEAQSIIQNKMKDKYVPQEFIDLEDKYKDLPTSQLEREIRQKGFEDLDRKTRRKMERILNKQNKKNNKRH